MKKNKNNTPEIKNQLIVGLIVGVLLSCDTVCYSIQTNGVEGLSDTSRIEPSRSQNNVVLVTNNTPLNARIEGWKLIWSDEFDANGAVDSTKWNYRIWKPGRVNEELQAYTNRIENSEVKNSCLTITALNDSSGGSHYTSARLVTDGKFEFTYGKVEVRAMIPGGIGSWPAIWMLGSNIDKVGWPDCGEIDIMEYVGFNPNFIHGTAHAKNYYWKIDKQQTKFIPVSGVETEYHRYGIEWYEDRIDFLFDGEVYFTAVPKGGDKNDLDAWPFSLPHFLILNVAVGGGWGGQKGIDESAFPMEMKVDYVRVYQKGQ